MIILLMDFQYIFFRLLKGFLFLLANSIFIFLLHTLVQVSYSYFFVLIPSVLLLFFLCSKDFYLWNTISFFLCDYLIFHSSQWLFAMAIFSNIVFWIIYEWQKKSTVLFFGEEDYNIKNALYTKNIKDLALYINSTFIVNNFHYLAKIKNQYPTKKVIIETQNQWFTLLQNTIKIPIENSISGKNIFLITNNEEIVQLILENFEKNNVIKILTFNSNFNFKNTLYYKKGIITELSKINNFIKISDIDIFLDCFEINSINYSIYKDFIFEISNYIIGKTYIGFFQKKVFFNEFLTNFFKKLLLIYLAKQNVEKAYFSILECGEFSNAKFEYDFLQYYKLNGACESECYFTSYENLINNINFYPEQDNKLKVQQVFDLQVSTKTINSIITNNNSNLNFKNFYLKNINQYFEIFDLYEQLIYQLKIMPAKTFVQQCLIAYLNELNQ